MQSLPESRPVLSHLLQIPLICRLDFADIRDSAPPIAADLSILREASTHTNPSPSIDFCSHMTDHFGSADR